MSRPKKYLEPRVTTAIRLPVPMHERLTAEADDRDVSVNHLITKAIERWIAQQDGATP